MATVGETSILANDGANIEDGHMRGLRFQAAGTFSALSMYVHARSSYGAAGDAVMGIYSDSGGDADSKLGQTAEFSIIQASSGGGAWHGVDLQAGVSIVSGTWYWLALHTQVAGIGQVQYRSAQSGGGLANIDLGSYSTTLPATFGIPSTTSSWNGSIYASSIVVGEPNLIDVELSNAGMHGASVSDSGLYGCTVSDSGLHGVTLSDSSRSS